MSKVNDIFDVIEVGIRAESLRQQTIANNVANLQTPGYHRVDVKFQDVLAKAMESSEPVDLDNVETEVYCPNETQVKSNGNDVSLETEVGQMVKNNLRHKTYVRLLQKKYQQIELAMNIK